MNKITLIFLLFPIFMFAQDDLLNDLESDVVQDNTVIATFKGLKIVNFESTKLASSKDLFLVIAHRFGSVKYGFNDFFGLDNAVTQIHTQTAWDRFNRIHFVLFSFLVFRGFLIL